MMTKDKIKYRPIEEPYHLPRIGMRIFKTMVAVLICLGLSLFRGEHSIPFYSAIATISVSYTHLDVYKRQACERIVVYIENGANFSIFRKKNNVI